MKQQINKYLVPILSFIICILIKGIQIFNGYNINIGIQICQFTKIIVCFAGFTMILISTGYRENNRGIVLAFGYLWIGFYILINAYISTQVFRVPGSWMSAYNNDIVIQIAEVLCMYSALILINEKYNVRMIIICMSSIFLISMPLSVGEGNHFIFLIKLNNIKGSVYWVLLGILIIGIIQNCIKYKIAKEEAYILKAAIYKSIVIVLMIINRHVRESYIHLLGHALDTVHCICIYRFVYERTMNHVWKKKGEDLNQIEIKLKEEELEQHNLIFSAYALKSYMQEIDNEANRVRKRLEKDTETSSLEYLRKINKNCKRLMKLSNNIVDLTQMEVGNISPAYRLTNINQFVKLLVESILPYIESKGLTIEMEITSKPIYCSIDRDEIERVLLNLISNAIKYNKKDGKIKVCVNKKQEKAFICIKDTGIGIPEENLKRIFDRFERVDNGFTKRQEGSGLGLCIVKSIIEMNKGTINIVSKENKGTLVSISLPIYKGQKGKVLELSSKKVLKRQDQIELEFSDLNK